MRLAGVSASIDEIGDMPSSRLSAIAAMASLDRPFGLNAPGTVEMLPSTPSGRIAASTAALLAVKATRSRSRQFGEIDLLS